MLKVNIHNFITNKKVNVKLALLADIHYSNKFELENRIINELNKEKPNYIILAGDIIDTTNYLDSKENRNKLKLFIERIATISKVFIILGGHDLEITHSNEYNYLERIKIWNNLFKNSDNVFILDNKNYTDKKINIIGITLSSDYYHKIPYENTNELTNILKNTDYNIYQTKYNILVLHSPQKILDKQNDKYIKGIDLILCGHMHAGVVPKMFRWIPTSRGLISPQKRLFPKYAYGISKYKIDNIETKLLVTGGVTKLSPGLPTFYQKLKCFYNNEFEIINIRGNNE